MIITLLKAIVALPQSMAAGAASVSDSSIRSVSSSSSSSSSADGQIGLVDLVATLLGAVAAGRPGRPLVAGDEMAEDLLGDQERALHLGDGVSRRLEEDDVVRALAVPVDLVRQPAAAPRGDLHDLAAGGDDPARGAVDDRLGLVVRHVGTQDQHEFVSAHAPGHSFQWENVPLTGDGPRARPDRRGTERKRCECSTGPSPSP